MTSSGIGYEGIDNAALLARCSALGLTTRESVAGAFCVTGQTVRAWAAEPAREIRRWTALVLAGCEAWEAGPLRGTSPGFPPAGPEWFRDWCLRRGLETYEDQGRQFGHARQTVCKWMRGGVPAWMPLACLGLDSGRVPILPRPSVYRPNRRKLKDRA